MDPQPYLDLIERHEWPALAALIIGLIVRLLKEDTRFPPFAFPARWRPFFALGLGALSGALQAVSTGTPWGEALLGGVISGALAIAGHGAIVDALRNGRDVPLFKLVKPPEAPAARVAEPPTPPDPSVPRA
jgi:hypothetical protein